MAEMTIEADRAEPHLNVKLLSHGTVETRDLVKARRFYEEMFGFEVRQTSQVSLMIRLNSLTTIACVQTKGPTKAGMFSHFGLDMGSREEVDAAHRKVTGLIDEYGIKKVTRPLAQHGTYAFYIVDMDDNWWEILTNPDKGYSYVFDLEDRSDTFGQQVKAEGDRQEAWKSKKADV